MRHCPTSRKISLGPQLYREIVMHQLLIVFLVLPSSCLYETFPIRLSPSLLAFPIQQPQQSTCVPSSSSRLSPHTCSNPDYVRRLSELLLLILRLRRKLSGIRVRVERLLRRRNRELRRERLRGRWSREVRLGRVERLICVRVIRGRSGELWLKIRRLMWVEREIADLRLSAWSKLLRVDLGERRESVRLNVR